MSSAPTIALVEEGPPGCRAQCSLWDPGVDENHVRSLHGLPVRDRAPAGRREPAGGDRGEAGAGSPGGLQFKRDNRWLADVNFLLYTVLYRDGRQMDAFAASKASYLIERLADSSPQLL